MFKHFAYKCVEYFYIKGEIIYTSGKVISFFPFNWNTYHDENATNYAFWI